jgi:hypothetical protein
MRDTVQWAPDTQAATPNPAEPDYLSAMRLIRSVTQAGSARRCGQPRLNVIKLEDAKVFIE